MVWIELPQAGQLSIGAVAATFSVLMTLSPFFVIRRVEKLRSPQDELFAPYFLLQLVSYVQLVYGCVILDIPTIVVNTVGVLSTAYYVDTLYYVSNNKHRMKMAAVVGRMWLCFTALWVTFYPSTPEDKKAHFGILNLVVLELSFVAPILNIIKGFRSKNPLCVPFVPGLLMAIMGTLWAFYGATKGNVTIFLPNATAVVFGTAQCVAYLILVPKREFLKAPLKYMPTVRALFRKKVVPILSPRFPTPHDPALADYGAVDSMEALNRYDGVTSQSTTNMLAGDLAESLAASRSTLPSGGVSSDQGDRFACSQSTEMLRDASNDINSDSDRSKPSEVTMARAEEQAGAAGMRSDGAVRRRKSTGISLPSFTIKPLEKAAGPESAEPDASASGKATQGRKASYFSVSLGDGEQPALVLQPPPASKLSRNRASLTPSLDVDSPVRQQSAESARRNQADRKFSLSPHHAKKGASFDKMPLSNACTVDEADEHRAHEE